MTVRTVADIRSPWRALAGLAPPPWTERALCAQVGDPDMFYGNGGESARTAKKVCAACPVRAECLAYALAHEGTQHAYGIWGGLAPKERRRYKRQTSCTTCGDLLPPRHVVQDIWRLYLRRSFGASPPQIP